MPELPGLFYGMSALATDRGNDVIVCGGLNNGTYLRACTLYDTIRNIWSLPTPLPVAMSMFAMLTLNRQPFVFGGYNSQIGVLNTVYSL